MSRLILASGSPRRRELLAKMGYTFEICSPDVDENVEGHARDVVQTLSVRKAHAVAEQYPDSVVIASDTLVSLDGKGLGKPRDRENAFEMLRSLSGREHEVFTGVCILDTKSGKERVCADRSGVRFKPLTDDEINAYIDSGEPMDRAGAYAIQGGAGPFVEQLTGSFENVMGFPVEVVAEMLKEFDLN